MIFPSIHQITNAKEKKFFIEKIDLIIYIINEMAGTQLSPQSTITFPIIDEFIRMGIIDSIDEVDTLKAMIGRKKYEKLIESFDYALNHWERYESLLAPFSNQKRQDLQRENEAEGKPTVVDFFCGAGGLSHGFVTAGFSIRLANDMDDESIETYRYNHPELSSEQIINEDIRTLINRIDMLMEEQVDVVIGGPPCQGFSHANQQRIIDDPRNELYKYFIKAIEKISPKFIVMENVRGMLAVADQVVEDYENIVTKDGFKYKTEYAMLNSHNFGVAQARERIFFIAIRQDVVEKKGIHPLHLFENLKAYQSTQFVLRDALIDIRPLEAERIKNRTEVYNCKTGKKVDKNEYKPEKGSYIDSINQGTYKPIIFNHKARYLNDTNYEIYRRLDEGDDATDPKIADIMPYAHRNHIFKDKYFKLIANRPSRTITAHLRMDGHSHIHPTQVRTLTPREAARIQSFPDDYLFLGSYLKTFMQVGNAVPPLMAKAIAKEIMQIIKE